MRKSRYDGDGAVRLPRTSRACVRHLRTGTNISISIREKKTPRAPLLGVAELRIDEAQDRPLFVRGQGESVVFADTKKEM